MRKTILAFSMLCCAAWLYGTTFTVQDFESCAIDSAFTTNNAGLSATVKADPTSTSSKSLYYSGSNNNLYATFNVTLPTGKTLADCENLTFDLYIASASYKNLEIWINGTKVHSSSNLINGTSKNLGTQTIAISTLNQSGASTAISAAGNAFTLGIGCSRMNGTTFYVDNIAFTGDLAAATNAYTVTFNAGSGNCATASLTEAAENAGVTLPTASPDTKCATAGYSFYGWATATCSKTTTAPTILSGTTFYPEQDSTLYAVYVNSSTYNSNPNCKTSANGTVTDGWLMVEDFEGYNLNDALSITKIWGSAGADGNSAVIIADPTNSDNQGVHITVSDGGYNDILALSVTLPAGKTLANYSQIKFNLYRNAADADYKQMIVKAGNDTLILSGFDPQAAVTTWTAKNYTISETVSAGNSFTLYVGIKTDGGDYLIDDIQLKERVTAHTSANGTVTNSWLMVEDFEGMTSGAALTTRAGSTATVADDPTGEVNYAAYITSAHYDEGIRLSVTLPTGKTITNYDQISFGFYWATAGYKQMRVYVDNTILYKDVNDSGSDNYIKQADAATWTTKTYDIPSDLTSANVLTLDLGLNDPSYLYYIDNIKLHEKATTPTDNTETTTFTIRYANGRVLLNKPAHGQVYDVTGKRHVSLQNTQSADISHLTQGVYIVKANEKTIKVIVK